MPSLRDGIGFSHTKWGKLHVSSKCDGPIRLDLQHTSTSASFGLLEVVATFLSGSDWHPIVANLPSKMARATGLTPQYGTRNSWWAWTVFPAPNLPDNRRDPSNHLRLSTAVHDQLDNIHWIFSDLGNQPTRWAEAVDSLPTLLGTVDACGMGMGGTWISPYPKLAPLLLRKPFPPMISAQLVSSCNTTGRLTNLYLEQTALVCIADVLASEYDIREHIISTLSNDTAAVSCKQ
jgi:hypothetical protein